jgi:hypothetical protein
MKRGKARLEKLSTQCPRHGRIRVVCPKCAGALGGKARQGRGRLQRLGRALAQAESEYLQDTPVDG